MHLKSRPNGAIQIRDVWILKFLSPHQSADFDQGSAVSPHPEQKKNIGSTLVRICTK